MSLPSLEYSLAACLVRADIHAGEQEELVACRSFAFRVTVLREMPQRGFLLKSWDGKMIVPLNIELESQMRGRVTGKKPCKSETRLVCIFLRGVVFLWLLRVWSSREPIVAVSMRVGCAVAVVAVRAEAWDDWVFGKCLLLAYLFLVLFSVCSFVVSFPVVLTLPFPLFVFSSLFPNFFLILQ